jgi:hypothetical protein
MPQNWRKNLKWAKEKAELTTPQGFFTIVEIKSLS